jgi:hypothetical protein
MPEQPPWRVEKYEDPMDPFATIQWYVMQGNVVIAQCEIEAYARRIVTDHERHLAYEQALEGISEMADLQAAIGAALRALESRD